MSAVIDDPVMTPSVRRFFQRSIFWIGIVTILAILAFIGLIFSGSLAGTGDPLTSTNPAPEGAKALVEVLRDEGVEVSAASTLGDAEDAITDPAGTTLFFYDYNGILTAEQFDDVLGLADTIVIVDPTYDEVEAVSSDVFLAGYVGDDELEADCSLDAAERAESISGGGNGFRIDGDAVGCFPSEDDVFSVVQVERDGTTITLLGAADILSNGRIVENGNAALALNLLGSEDSLVWYIPGIDDYIDRPATAADFSPAWVVPVTLVLLLTFIAAAVWRGRRFGPLIVENLPVTVRASETMQGRARLYQHSSARLHTLDSLRIGTIDRLAKLVGLPVLATTDEVVRSVAATTGRDEREVRLLLVDAVPGTDRELIELSDQLLTLEALVATKLRPE